jgi:hypothetical protein
MESLAVTVKNDSSHDLFIDGDPNWDDQVLTIDGTPHQKAYRLPAGSSAVVGITADYNEMGVMFGSGTGSWFYQLSIGPDDTGNQSVTDDSTEGTPAVTYTLQDQAPLSMTMDFVDANS